MRSRQAFALLWIVDHVKKKDRSIIQSKDTIYEWPLRLNVRQPHVTVCCLNLLCLALHQYVERDGAGGRGLSLATSTLLVYALFLSFFCQVTSIFLCFQLVHTPCNLFDAVAVAPICQPNRCDGKTNARLSSTLKNTRGQLRLTIHKRATDWRFRSHVRPCSARLRALHSRQ